MNNPGPRENMEESEARAPTELVATVVATAVSWAVCAISIDYPLDNDLQSEGVDSSPPLHSKSGRISQQSKLHSFSGPGSHFSFPTKSPSLHISKQMSGLAPLQLQPGEGREQSSRQPGFKPASQVSNPTLNPSLHIGVQIVFEVEFPPTQLHFGSKLWQSGRQLITPKGATCGPSSHVSFPTTQPSPQIETQVEFPFGVCVQFHPSATP